MPGITFNDFRANVRDIARPNRFLLSIPTPPAGVGGFDFSDNMQYHVKSASIPTRSVGDISNLFYFGQNFKLSGDPTYDDYTVIFHNNVNFEVKNLMESWIDLEANPITNIRSVHAEYKGVIKLDQIGRGTNIIATYFLHGVYPKSLDAVELSHESTDAIEEFTVNFSIDYWSNNLTPGAGEGVGLLGSPI